jgi:hypothetical protein
MLRALGKSGSLLGRIVLKFVSSQTEGFYDEKFFPNGTARPDDTRERTPRRGTGAKTGDALSVIG